MIKFVPIIHKFQSHIDTRVGWQTNIHIGDQVEVEERWDGLWNIKVNDVPTGYAIDNFSINQMAGSILVGA